MKKLSFVLLLLAGPALAQEATLNTPVARPSESKIAAKLIQIEQAKVVVSLSVRDASSSEIRYYDVAIPDAATPTATVAGFVVAIDTVRATETGGALRKLQFRVLGYLFDTGYLPGVTLVP